MVSSAGAGPPSIPQKQLDSQNLAEAIRFCFSPEASSAANTIAETMRSEPGVSRAVASFHANLPLDTMRCSLLPNLPASWVYNKRGRCLKLSKAAAELLLCNSAVEKADLRQQVYLISDRCPPSNFFLGTRAARSTLRSGDGTLSQRRHLLWPRRPRT